MEGKTIFKTGGYGVSAIDDDWVVDQMIKYYKFGFGAVTDYLNFEIRLGKISRSKAIKIVKRYDGSCDQNIIKIFEYIEIVSNNFGLKFKK